MRSKKIWMCLQLAIALLIGVWNIHLANNEEFSVNGSSWQTGFFAADHHDNGDQLQQAGRIVHNRYYNNPFFHNVQRDLFCHGCRHNTKGQKDGSCALPLAEGIFKPQNLSLSDSMTVLLDETDATHNSNLSSLTMHDLPQDCQRCLDCPAQNHWYGRMDEAAPPAVQAVSHYLTSIPDIHRFPRNVSSWSTFFQEDHPNNQFPQRIYLAEYNPSIVRVPINQIPSALNGESVVYLASFRVTPVQLCKNFPAMFDPSNQKHLRDRLGLAYLRQDLSLVSDAVFDLKRQGINSIGDSRLFVLHNQLYWSAGALLHRLWMVRDEDNPPPAGTIEVPPEFSHKSSLWQAPNYIMIQKQPICARRVSHRMGKNFQFFVDATETVVAEIYPMMKKVSLNTSSVCPESIGEERPLNTSLPERSFGTADELHFWRQGVFDGLLTNERGSYCCAPLNIPGRMNNRTLLLGISHSKFAFVNRETRYSLPGNVSANHYFSTFYSMEASPPYTVVARSGKFCLGFPTQDEYANGNPHAQATEWNRLRLASDYFDCPAVHFVSGLTDTPDGDHFIIAYGVNDCSSRMIKVRKTDVIRILFPGESEDESR